MFKCKYNFKLNFLSIHMIWYWNSCWNVKKIYIKLVHWSINSQRSLLYLHTSIYKYLHYLLWLGSLILDRQILVQTNDTEVLCGQLGSVGFKQTTQWHCLQQCSPWPKYSFYLPEKAKNDTKWILCCVCLSFNFQNYESKNFC